MNPYWVIAIIILALGVVQTYAWRRAREGTWYQVGLLAMVLEVYARAARDRQRAKDKRKVE